MRAINNLNNIQTDLFSFYKYTANKKISNKLFSRHLCNMVNGSICIAKFGDKSLLTKLVSKYRKKNLYFPKNKKKPITFFNKTRKYALSE